MDLLIAYWLIPPFLANEEGNIPIFIVPQNDLSLDASENQMGKRP
jgi:hypothetical protein